MKMVCPRIRSCCTGFVLCAAQFLPAVFIPTTAVLAEETTLEVGIAVRDISPALPIRLAGYASRNRPADTLDHPLVVQALALKDSSGARFVFVMLDNCEVSRAFMQPVLERLANEHRLGPGAVAVLSSHTHSAPVLAETLSDMAQPTPAEGERIQEYSRSLQAKLVEVVGAALADCRPASLERGLGRATFAMNRRVYDGDQVVFGDNPDGPVDWDVPVLRVKGADGAVRAVLFGYACHGTSVRGGDDWYVVSGEYMAYARRHLESLEPGAVAMYLPGMGADSDPAPRGRLIDAKRHGLELAGAVVGVLDRPMRRVNGTFKFVYEEVDLPLAPPPGREQLEKDARSEDVHVKMRAARYLKLLDAGQPLPGAVKLPLAALRFGDDLTLVFMGGEVVVDYSRRLKRVLARDQVWTVGYAYEVPCYIPSARLIKEGGYETESSLIYYGFYGPFRTSVEVQILNRLETLVAGLRARS
jgi:neutral ceramidase